MNSAGSVFVLGSGRFAEEVATVLEEIPDVRVAGLVESQDPARCGTSAAGWPTIWVEDLREAAQTHRAIAGLGTTHRRAFIEQVAGYGMPFGTFVHPSAKLPTNLYVGKGVYVGVNVAVGGHTTIADHVVVNRGTLIGHHTDIGSYTTISPGVNIAGSCHVGVGVYIGMGAIVLDHIRVGDGAVIGAGAVVTRDVPERTQVIGVPARIVKEDIGGL